MLFSNILVAKYNTFTLLLFYIIYFIELKNYKYKDYLIGLLLSITIFTKINIGAALIIPTLILYYKSPKIIFKRLLTIAIFSIIVMTILFITKSLPDFLNYTVYGLFDFLNKTSTSNRGIEFFIMIIFLLTITFILIHNNRKDKKISYLIAYMIMAFPIFDYYHTILGLIPTFLYFLDKIKFNRLNKIIFISSAIFANILLFSNLSISKIDCQNKYCSQNSTINNTFDKVHQINQIIQKKYSDYLIFYFNYNAYFYKLDLHQNINKYDFIWRGNMGFNGEKQFIKEISNYCNTNKCLFVINEDNIKNYSSIDNSISLKILEFITTKYQKKENILYETVSIYTNDNIKKKENFIQFPLSYY